MGYKNLEQESYGLQANENSLATILSLRFNSRDIILRDTALILSIREGRCRFTPSDYIKSDIHEILSQRLTPLGP